jgi:hypothetical protein
MNTQQVAIRNEEETREGMPAESGNALAVQSSLAVSLARAEVDQQVATARALPRSIQRAVNNITTLATLDEETAAECIYALPRGGKTVRGPSIRFAEIAASQWGNCRIGARVVHVDRIEEYVEAEGVFHDLETNVAQTARVRRQIQRKRGKGIDADMIQLAGAAACSIARRNAILAGIPKGVTRRGYVAVEEVIRGDIKTLSERRALAIKAFGLLGVTPERLFATLGISGEDDLNLDHLMTLTGTRSAIKNGELTVEEAFPAAKPTNGDAPKSLGDRLGKMASDKSDEKVDPDTGEITKTDSVVSTMNQRAEMVHDNVRHVIAEQESRPATSEAPEPAGGVPPGPAEATPQGPLEGAAVPAPGAAAPSDAEADRRARVAEIHETGDARAQAGSAALLNYLEQLRENGESDLVNAAVKSVWRDTARAADAKGRKA